MLLAQSDGMIQPTVEESQGSVQNVAEAGRRPGAFLFTTPPNLIDDALAGREPFEGGDYDSIPHLVPDALHHHPSGGAGRQRHHLGRRSCRAQLPFPAGRARSASARSPRSSRTLGIADSVTAPEMELSGAPGGRCATTRWMAMRPVSSHPTPQVQELAATLPVRILSFSPEEQDAIMAANPGGGRGPASSPAPMPGSRTTSRRWPFRSGPMPPIWTRKRRSPSSRAFWEQREDMAGTNPWWAGVTPELVPQTGRAAA